MARDQRAAPGWQALVDWIGRPWESRAALTYLLILLANRVVIFSLADFTTPRGRPLPLDTLVLRAVSTNLSRLRSDPFDVLVASALFVESTWMVVAFVVLAVLILVPLERRIGATRWVATFAIGHVGATLIVAAGLVLAVDAHRVAPTTVRTIDVGLSYGTAALLGVAAMRLPDRRRGLRALAVAALLTVVFAGVAIGRTFTDWGHLVAALIGLALGVAFAEPDRSPGQAAVPAAVDTGAGADASAVARTGEAGVGR